jgi:hypothetical protein
MIHTTAGYLIYGAISLIVYLYIAYCLREFARKQAARRPWLAWIPIFDVYLMCTLAGHGAWWTIWMFIPIVDIIPAVIIIMRFARMRGHRGAFGLLLLIPLVNYIAMWVLAFGRPGRRLAPAY